MLLQVPGSHGTERIEQWVFKSIGLAIGFW